MVYVGVCGDQDDIRVFIPELLRFGLLYREVFGLGKRRSGGKHDYCICGEEG